MLGITGYLNAAHQCNVSGFQTLINLHKMGSHERLWSGIEPLTVHTAY